MAVDENLANRVRALVPRGKSAPAVEEKRMFGGIAVMLNGHMAVVMRGKGGLMVRVDPAESERLEAEPGAHAAEMRGRPMRGWITVDASACAKDADLRRWVDRGFSYARGLPPK